jgi:hypothetical protein
MLRLVPTALAVLTLVSLFPLGVWHASPRHFPADAHDVLAATPLALIAMAYLAYQRSRRAPPLELLKATLVVIAFLSWAANQLWPGGQLGVVLNDIAIAAFVLDLSLVIIGRPAPSGQAPPGAQAHRQAL